MLNILFLIGGLAVIIIGADRLVEGASALARRFGISDLVIGLTIVSIGTSAPELTVNIFSALEGKTDIAIGNVLGSNIANIYLILGISSIIYTLDIQQSTKWKEIPFSLLAVVVLAIIANDIFIDNAKDNVLSRIDGMVLLSFFIIFLIYTFGLAKKQNGIPAETFVKPAKKRSLGSSILFIVLGFVALYFGGKYFVEGAVNIAKFLGMSDKVIGLTIVAVGTSLPELATSVVAAIKKNTDIAVGNIVGSNIFNIFFILGITAVITPVSVASVNFDLFVAGFASVLLFLSTITMGQKQITRPEGIIFLLIYVSYVVYSIIS